MVFSIAIALLIPSFINSQGRVLNNRLSCDRCLKMKSRDHFEFMLYPFQIIYCLKFPWEPQHLYFSK